MIVYLAYVDASDESHEVAQDVADALVQGWLAFQQDVTLSMPPTFTAVSGDVIAMRWEALEDLQIDEGAVVSEDQNVAGFSAPTPADPTIPMEIPSRGS